MLFYWVLAGIGQGFVPLRTSLFSRLAPSNRCQMGLIQSMLCFWVPEGLEQSRRESRFCALRLPTPRAKGQDKILACS